MPINKPPSLRHTSTTTSSGSDRSSSEIFSGLSSTSVTSAASSKHSLDLSSPHSQAQNQSYGQVPRQGQRARGQPFQTPSPHPTSSPEMSHSASSSLSTSASSHLHLHLHPRSSSHHRSSPSPARPSQPCSHTTSSRSSSRLSSSKPNQQQQQQQQPQRPGPISLPPPLLPSQVAFSIPLQQLSPHPLTPLGMSVSVSVSPLVEYPGGFGYVNGMFGQHQQYNQQQQFGQSLPAHGLPPMTPSMPSFTFLPSGSHTTPTGTSIRVGTGCGHSGGHKHTRSRSKSFARRVEMESELDSVVGDEDENVLSNSNVSLGSRRSSSASPPSSSARQRYPHPHQQHHHQNQQQYNTHSQPIQVNKIVSFPNINLFFFLLPIITTGTATLPSKPTIST